MANENFTATQIQGISATELHAKFDLIFNKLEEIAKQPPQHLEDVYLTRNEVADFLNISLVTLHNWRKSGLVKAYRIGNAVRFKQSEIKQALKDISAKK